MKTVSRDFQHWSPLKIFLSYFGNHKALFAVDMSCAICIALIDLAFPLVTRKALYDLLPEGKYRTFFALMAAVVFFYVIRALLNYTVCFSATFSASGWRRTSAGTCSPTCRK